MAMIVNPFAERFADDLRPLFKARAMLGERPMQELVKLLDEQAVSYGKGAVGVDGEMEHGGACVGPMLGGPMRAVIGGGKAMISSKVKAAAGASVGVALDHKDDPWSFSHFDTITVSMADAPRPGRHRYRLWWTAAERRWDANRTTGVGANRHDGSIIGDRDRGTR
jgi:hypothetical protein